MSPTLRSTFRRLLLILAPRRAVAKLIGRTGVACLLAAALVGCLASVNPAFALDPGDVLSGLKDKGWDWLKDKAKQKAEDWVFDTGQSETMQDILKKCQAATGGTSGLATMEGRCKPIVFMLAIDALSGINFSNFGKNIAKVGFDTAVKMGTLGAGGAAAAGEGAFVKWLIQQYRDGIKDTVLEKLKELFFKEKKPEFELYETSGKDGPCDYSVRAVWDILGGTYKVLIKGDCHCKENVPTAAQKKALGTAGSAIQSYKLGAWWVSFEGKVQLSADTGKQTITWLPQSPTKVDWDGQCGNCSKPLKEAFTATGKEPGTTTGGVTETPPPAVHPADCEACKKAEAERQAKIAKLEGELEQLNRDENREINLVNSAKNRGDTATANEEQGTLDKIRADEKAKQAELDKLKKEKAKCPDACGSSLRSALPGIPGDDEQPQGPQYVARPGDDVRKNDLLLTDSSTQQEIPGGEVFTIPEDPKKPIPPPRRVADGKVTLPETQPGDRVVVLTDDHQKVELQGGDLPTDTGEHVTIPEQPRRMIVHETPCSAVTDGMVAAGLADQYGERIVAATGGWRGADYRYADAAASVTDCLVTVPRHEPLQPGPPRTDGGKTASGGGPVIEGGGKVPKDGPTVTHDGKVIEGDQPREIQGAAPSEPYATSQGSWGQPYTDQWYLRAVHWLKGDGTSVLPERAAPVTVAVIDTGVDFTHPELAEAQWINPDPGRRGDRNGWNFVDRSADNRDFSGHGTIVAGLIAAASHDRFGIAGINPWARIMALKALEIDGRGGSINLAQAIVYAADHGARVINISAGGRTLTRMEQEAIDYAARRDALVVVAAGNDGIETRNFSPAGLKNVLAVAAVGPDLRRQVFSNWGATIGIAAPGVDILSLRARQTDLLQNTRRDYKPGSAVVAGQFYRVTGSSFAAPIVAGAASLLFSVRPSLTAAQVKRMLLQTARDLDDVGINQFSGYGLLDIEAALAADPDHYVEAAINAVGLVQIRGATFVRVTGTADADALKDAHVELAAGDNPQQWRPVSRPLAKPVVNAPLAELPASAFRGSKQWTLRVIVTNRSGLRREARFKLTLG